MEMKAFHQAEGAVFIKTLYCSTLTQRTGLLALRRCLIFAKSQPGAAIAF